MEIGIAAWAFNRSILRDKTMTQLEFVAIARQEYGVDTIELVSTFFPSQSADYLTELRRAIEKERLRVVNIAVDTGHLLRPDLADRKTHLEAMKQWFHVARAVGAEAIRVNTGAGSPDDRAALDMALAGYRELAEHGAAPGVKLLIENHGGLSSDAKVIARLLNEVDPKWFGACPDVDNFPEGTWEEGMKVMAPRSVAVHIKSAGYDPAGKQASERNGQPHTFDLKRCLQILRESDYRGPINYEYNHAETDEKVGVRKGIEYTRQLLASL